MPWHDYDNPDYDDSPKGIADEGRRQQQVFMEMRKKQLEQAEDQQKLKQSVAPLEKMMRERGLAHGDIFPVFLDRKELVKRLQETDAKTIMVEISADLRTASKGENFVKFVQVTRSETNSVESLVS